MTGSHADGSASKESILAVYSYFGWVSVAIGVGVLVLSPLVKRWMHLDTLRDDDDAMLGQSELGEPQAAGVNTSKETL